MTTPLLHVADLTKNFGGLTALAGVHIEVRSGTIHGLIGPNGSGKSTFINTVTGVIPPNSGQIVIDGRNVAGLRPNIVNAAGIARTFQNLRLFKAMSVLDNVLIGEHRHMGYGLGSALTMRNGEAERHVKDVAMGLLADVGLAHRAEAISGSLPYGEQRLLEIARALATQPKLLMLDEPLAGMNPTEMDRVVAILRRIVARGVTILLVEHAVRVVMSVCDRISVLNFGRNIAEGSPQEIQGNEDVVVAYLGRRRHVA
ncbi:ABC transporter ATP-binding protein [Microvirga pudoricolor]|uniref:ABC transporter ATP-binding protein n=1 Tax=Microvirga pudoricolor TaxID=2778729 RepID=UPI00195023EC|nr:ABC transporter ATP-binding protein [Microvirga pudoricolor]MBM6595306.1 ABC transporter ATP-binding protein [Microvirga pudoricolor]